MSPNQLTYPLIPCQLKQYHLHVIDI